MDKKIPPVPPRRPIPQKPNIVRQPPKKPVIKKNTEENANGLEEIKNLEEKVVENTAATQTPIETNEKTLQASQSAVIAEEQTEPKLDEQAQEQVDEQQIEDIDSNINNEVVLDQIDENSDIESNTAQASEVKDNKKAKKAKKEKPKQEISVEKLNEKYKTILLSILSAVCLVGAIICFVFMVL